MRRRNLTGAQVVLPDKCRCGQDVAKAAKADRNAESNFGWCQYELACVNCSVFRGYIGRSLEQLLEQTNAQQPIRLGARKKKGTSHDDDSSI
jgi:hypothetical protein